MNPYDYINEKDGHIISIDYKRFNEDLEKVKKESFVDGIITANRWLIDNGYLKASENLTEVLLQKHITSLTGVKK